ncbi:MAG: hypothetical protein KIS96_14545 [Bauldia sp.]|nr:hypothetical protein [Bauldia sp.]
MRIIPIAAALTLAGNPSFAACTMAYCDDDPPAGRERSYYSDYDRQLPPSQYEREDHSPYVDSPYETPNLRGGRQLLDSPLDQPDRFGGRELRDSLYDY